MGKTAIVQGVVTAALLASPAGAEIWCVNPQGTGPCFATIQAAVDRAAPGDTIRIARGVYYEAVVVGPGKDGLQIVGAGPRATVLDGSPFFDRGFAGSETTLAIDSPYVKVRTLGFRNGRVGVAVGREHVVLQGLEFRGTDVGITITFAAHTEILGNAFYDGLAGVGVRGADMLARGNRFERVGTGFSFDPPSRPDRPRIIANVLEGVSGGIVMGQVVEAEIRSNQLRHSGGVGANGLNPVVEGNTLLQGQGITVFCNGLNFEAGPGDDIPADCRRASVSSNRVVDANSLGMVVAGLAPTMVVRQNVLIRTDGLVLSGTGRPDDLSPMDVQRNQVEIAGSTRPPDFHSRRPCYEVFSIGATLTGNSALGCAHQGFLIRGGKNVLIGNRAVGGAGSGFLVDGIQVDGITPTTEVVLQGNTSLRNAAQGIAVASGAEQTQVIGNVASGNRTDYCDEGSFTGASDNTFGTTGGCVIDH